MVVDDDEDYYGQIIRNLQINADKYSSAGKNSIEITAQVNDGSVAVRSHIWPELVTYSSVFAIALTIAADIPEESENG